MDSTELVKAFDQMPRNEQIQVAKLINERVADALFDELDAELPDVDVSEEEIMNEVRAVRYDRHPK